MLAVMVGAMVWAASSVPPRSQPCPGSRFANDEPGSLNEAFFQDPADQSELLQALEACSK
ncbi:hypothetical protein HHL14_11000 [Paraburkholderia sp. G-4-1-8]|uniref:Uncharacterized protein n=1 Tax=Paraburkholderia antibiotica TaxID=2728839 RepID=A0A7X9ZYH4_9BURK|nr:hypothetical protein [Paraburkholderia antibiotica]